VVTTVASFPMCIDFLPDGRLLVVDSAQRHLLRREPDGSLVEHADLSAVSEKPWNDIVVDDSGNAYVNSIGFDFPGEEFAPGLVVLVAPEGTVEQVADNLAFPNGMAITPDGGTLVVAESYANRLTGYDIGGDGRLSNRRIWAETPGDHPDGICMDVEGAVWYADVGNRHCVRVREGGEVLATVDLDRGAFACALSRGNDPRLFVVGQIWGGPEPSQPTGRVVALPAPAPGAGKP
jgi:sugar lactone lactonase YvrE